MLISPLVYKSYVLVDVSICVEIEPSDCGHGDAHDHPHVDDI
jgi:hypothetical protein